MVDDDIRKIFYIIAIPFCSQLHHFTPDYGHWVWHPSSGSEKSQTQNYKKGVSRNIRTKNLNSSFALIINVRI